MRLTATTEVDAPRSRVFDRLSDIPTLEEMVRDRGAEVTRLDDGADGPAGAAWRLSLPLHGRTRTAAARVTAHEPEDRIEVAADLDGIDARIELTLAALSPGRTALAADLHIGARTMTGRLLVQPLKLARGNLEERLKRRLDAFARRIEAETAGGA